MICPMTDLRWSSLDVDSVGAWSALTNILATADGTEDFYEPEDLAEELGETGMEPSSDTWAVWAGGQLVAYGQLRVGFTTQADGTVRCQLDGGVHPDWRGRGIGRRLMDEMEERTRALSAERLPGVTAQFRVEAGLAGSSAGRMLSARGYQVARWFILMELQLDADGAQAGFTAPDGVVLVTPQDDDEEAVRVAHNSAFADHWGSAPMTAERWHDFYAGRPMRLPYSTIGKTADGEVVSYVLVGQYLADEVYVDLVGTVAGARGRGVAAAALARTIERVRAEEGLRVLGLEVDSDSPTGATRLYERLGFTPKNTRATMTRPA